MTIPTFESYQFQNLTQDEVNAFKCMERNDPFRRLLPQSLDMALAGTITVAPKLHMTSAQILNLHTSPIMLIPSPGAGKVIKLMSCVIRYNFGTVNYSLTPISFRYQGGTAASSNNVFTSGASIIKDIGFVTNIAMLANVPIIIDAGANPTGGDGTIDVYFSYQTITL